VESRVKLADVLNKALPTQVACFINPISLPGNYRRSLVENNCVCKYLHYYKVVMLLLLYPQLLSMSSSTYLPRYVWR
jgi:hypothetical protein